MAQESPGRTPQVTALVHEAYVGLVDTEQAQHWDSRGHFFAAAADAMRRILVESARRKARFKHGGRVERRTLAEEDLVVPNDVEDVLAIDDALNRLAEIDRVAAELVKLRYFAGMTVDQAAELLGMSVRSAYYAWDYARSWLRSEMQND